MENRSRTPGETDIDSEAERTARVLAAQKKVAVTVPRLGTKLKPDELDKIPVPVTVNGYTWLLRRGETAEVPQGVAELLRESGYIA